MKQLLAAAALMLFPAVAFASDATTTVKVSGWHCEGCAGETTAELKKLKGVKSATPDFEKGQVVVAYDDAKLKPADLEQAVKKSGYQVVK